MKLDTPIPVAAARIIQLPRSRYEHEPGNEWAAEYRRALQNVLTNFLSHHNENRFHEEIAAVVLDFDKRGLPVLAEKKISWLDTEPTPYEGEDRDKFEIRLAKHRRKVRRVQEHNAFFRSERERWQELLARRDERLEREGMQDDAMTGPDRRMEK